MSSREGFIQQGVGVGLSVDLVKLSIEYRSPQGVKPNPLALLLAAEANVIFWRKVLIEDGGMTTTKVELMQQLAVTVAQRMRESMQKSGLMDTVH